MPTAAELLFKIQAVGTDQLKQVAATVDAVRQGTQLAGAQLKTFDSTLNALAASGKTYTQALEEMARSNGVLSNSVRSTAAALLLQQKAAQGDEAAIRKLAGTTQSLVGANIAAGAAIRDFTGQSNVRAIESLLTKVLGLGSAFQSLFLLTGVAAAGEELYRLWEKYDPLEKATRDLTEANRELDGSYARVTNTIAGYIQAQARATLGAAGAKGVASYDAGTLRAEAASQQQYYLDQVKKAQDSLNSGREDSILPGLAGAFLTQRDQAAARARIATLQDKADEAGLRVREYDTKGKTDDVQEKADKDKGARRDAAELAKRQTQELINLQRQLAEIGAKELSNIEKINVNRDATLARLREEGTLTNATTKANQTILDLVTQIAEKEKIDVSDKGISAALKGGRAAIRKTDADQTREDNRTYDLINDEQLTYMDELRKSIQDAQNKAAASALHVANRGDQSAADQVRQRANLAIYENNKGTGSGSHGGAAAANADYQVRIKAANEIFAIETRHLDLITEEGKREDALADARKKNADELYNAEREHEEALDALREKDIQKYHTLAESVFDALTDRMHGSGWDFREMFRGAAHTLGSQVFANATQGIFQTGGHALASLSGGSTFGGLLKGTVFDPANKGVHADPHQLQIEQHTKDTADWLSKLYQLASGQQSSDPAGANPSASPASIAGATASGVMSNPLSALAAMATASLPAALGGTGTATTAASAASGLSGFLKAITGAGGSSSAFGTGMSSVLSGGALGNILYGGPAYGGSTMSQVGSAVGLAGALGGSALAIASGISQGGVSGGLKAAGGAVGAATTLASNIAPLLNTVLPAAIPVIGSVIAAALPLIGGLFGTGPQQRANQITNELAQNAFLPNTALNTIQNTNGTLLSMDAHGNLRTSSLNALPTVAEPYITSERLNGSPYRTYQNAPGGVTQGYSGSVTGTGQAPVSNAPAPVVNNHYYVSTMDAQSFHEYLQKSSSSRAVGEAVINHLTSGGGENLASMIRFHVG